MGRVSCGGERGPLSSLTPIFASERRTGRNSEPPWSSHLFERQPTAMARHFGPGFHAATRSPESNTARVKSPESSPPGLNV